MAKGETYEGFVAKFQRDHKKTTDDCYTPKEVYEAVRDWACKKYSIDPDKIIRPFYPGGEYESEDYTGKVVLDNPPFSILSKIIRFYLKNKIPFFLFAPHLTCLSGGADVVMQVNHIFTDSRIVYHNGAVVYTAFVTSYGENLAETAPDLSETLKKIQQNGKMDEKLRYQYPNEVVTGAMLGNYVRAGLKFEIKRTEAMKIKALDAQKEQGKSIFGDGLLLTKEKAEEHQKIRQQHEKMGEEKSPLIVWELSQREREIVDTMGETLGDKFKED